MTEYAVFLHEDSATFKDLSPNEFQAIIQKYFAWQEKIRTENRFVLGKKLTNEGGRHISGKMGKMEVSDGPYAETKDIVGGLFIIRAENYEDALSALADCPHLNYGWIELRAVDPVT